MGEGFSVPSRSNGWPVPNEIDERPEPTDDGPFDLDAPDAMETALPLEERKIELKGAGKRPAASLERSSRSKRRDGSGRRTARPDTSGH